MDNIVNKDSRDKFKFLDDKTANEPHIYEVLNEILRYQTQSLPSGINMLATMEVLKKSRNIKIPFTSTREKTIEYLVDLLLKNCKNFVKPIISFDFNIEESTKNLNIVESIEYTIVLNDKDYKILLSNREAKSLNNLFRLLTRYRLFNLSKLIKNTKNKSELSRMIKTVLGKKIFTFKKYRLDKDKIEWGEDYCFHADNYESVKTSLNLNELKDIISYYSDPVKRGLNKFGILNADFSDYRDSKLSYIFNVLIEDLATTLSDKDLTSVKNIQSLVSCLNKVDKILDPILIINDDIIKYIREHTICTESELISAIIELTSENLKKWVTNENLKMNKILYYSHEDGEVYFIDGTKFFSMISELNQMILYQPEKMDELPLPERRKVKFNMEILYRTSIGLFTSEEKINDLLNINSQKLLTLKKIVEEYENYTQKLTEKKYYEAVTPKHKRKKPFFKSILGFIKSIFSIFKREKIKNKKVLDHTTTSKEELSHEARKIYRKTINKNAPIIPLSNFIELTPENDYLIDRIINDLREHNLKIVIPIYNSRKNLYPKTSKKLLLPDIEYLLVSINRAQSSEAIREFADSLVGYKIKDEIIPASAIMAIEKYLLTLYRQRRSPTNR